MMSFARPFVRAIFLLFVRLWIDYRNLPKTRELQSMVADRPDSRASFCLNCARKSASQRTRIHAARVQGLLSAKPCTEREREREEER